ncbi:unnamed protein product [Sympodiomycopsis kandeliae]
MSEKPSEWAVHPHLPSYDQHVHSPVVGTSFEYQQSPHPSTQNDHRTLPPYLTLRPLLFLSIFSPLTLSLLFTSIHLALDSADIQDKVSHAKQDLLQACTRAEDRMSVIASFPRYIAGNVEQGIVDSVQHVVQGTGNVLILSLAAIEAVLVFIVDSYRSLFLCFIELLVRGSLSLLMSAVDLMNTAVKDASSGIKTAIQASVSGVNDFLSTTLNGINDIISVFGQHVSVPNVAQPDLSALDNVQLPTSFMDSLTKLNASLPTLNELRDKMDTVIREPLQNVQREVNQTISGYTFNTSMLPALPPAQQVRFCDRMDTSPLDRLAKDGRKYILIGLLIMLILIVLMTMASLTSTWWAWKCQQRNLSRIRSLWNTQGRDDMSDHGIRDKLSMASHPILATIASSYGPRVGLKSRRAQNHTRWWLNAVTHPMLVAFAGVGIIGLLSVQIQMAGVGVLETRYNGEMSTSLDSLTTTAFAELNKTTFEASQQYSNKSNTIILSSQNDLNNHLFKWVNNTNSVMNNTLNEITDEITSMLNSTFSNTPLYTPLQSFINCILLQKIRGIQNALDWLSSHAHVDFPLVDDDVLLASDTSQQELMGPVQDGVVGKDGVAAGIFDSYREKLKLQRLFFAAIMALYAVIVIAAAFIAAFYRPRKVYGKDIQTPDCSQEDDDDDDGTAARSHHSITAPLTLPLPKQYNPSPQFEFGPNQMFDIPLEESPHPMRTFQLQHAQTCKR